MNDALFQITAAIVGLTFVSGLATFRLGLSAADRDNRGSRGRNPWLAGWSAATSCVDQSPSAIAWGGAGLTAAWLSGLVIVADAAWGGLVSPSTSRDGSLPLLFVGLVLLSDWCSRQSRRDAGRRIPWQGWCLFSACAAGDPWNGMLTGRSLSVGWDGGWLPSAVTAWTLASLSDLPMPVEEAGISRLAGVVRRWTILAFGVLALWGGGEFPGTPRDVPGLPIVVVCVKVIVLELSFSLVAARMRKSSFGASVWLACIGSAFAGGLLARVSIGLLGRDGILVLLLQVVAVVCGLLLVRRATCEISPPAASDTGSTVG